MSYEFLFKYGSWSWPFMYIAGALLFTAGGQGWNPLMWRSFSQADPLMYWMHDHFSWSGWGAEFSDHHFVNIVGEGLVCVGLAAWFSRAQKTSILNWGLLSTYGGILIWAVHEGIWWIVYVALWSPKDLSILSGMGEIIVFGLVVMTQALGLYFPKRFLVWMLAFYTAWIAAGFPITESFLGNTPLYSSFSANAWEDASWLWGFFGFFWLERDGLLGWFERVKSIALRGQLNQTSI